MREMRPVATGICSGPCALMKPKRWLPRHVAHWMWRLVGGSSHLKREYRRDIRSWVTRSNDDLVGFKMFQLLFFFQHLEIGCWSPINSFSEVETTNQKELPLDLWFQHVLNWTVSRTYIPVWEGDSPVVNIFWVGPWSDGMLFQRWQQFPVGTSSLRPRWCG